MIYTFLYHVKMVSARLKMLILKVDITVSVMTTALTQMKHEVKATKRSPPDNLMILIITQTKRFRRKGIEKVSRSVRAYVYLVLTSQASKIKHSG